MRTALQARRFGAVGVGPCRTEHMFLGDRRPWSNGSSSPIPTREKQGALDALLPMQRQDFVEILEAMDGLPVTIRLLDPPLHEFLPISPSCPSRVALAESRNDDDRADNLRLLGRFAGCTRVKPDARSARRPARPGHRRPIRHAGRAILEATAERVKAGGDPRPEIMVPLVGAVQELESIKEEIVRVAKEVSVATGVDLQPMVGTMIELPRAALTADLIAEAAEFFSFGKRPHPDHVGLLA